MRPPPSDLPTPAPDRRAGTVGPDGAPESLPTVPVPGTPSPPDGALTQPFVGGKDDPRPTLPGYEIASELGRGGMGVVYKARHLALNRPVAVKMILHPDHAGETERARFQAEAEAVAQLVHPNIITIYEVGTFQCLPYYSMEHCAGGSLHALLRKGPLPAAAAAQLVELLARAMEFAHDNGIVHRDLKPSNVLLTSDGTPKITDFGLAKRLGNEQGLTRTGALLGTPAYAAPEQTGGLKEVGPLADVYSLGAILYECLTGRPPFQAPSSVDTAWQVMHQEPVPVRALQPAAPRDLETITLKCLQKDPRRRYASAGALADDLRRFRTGEAIAARPIGTVKRLVGWCRRRPAVAGLTGLVFTLLLVIAVGASVIGLQLKAALDQSRSDHEQVARERDRATQAERRALQLFDSYTAEARARRSSRQVGQRFQALEAVARALAIARKRGLPPERLGQVRTEAIAALALADLRPAEWMRPPRGDDLLYGTFDMAPSLERYVYAHPEGSTVFTGPAWHPGGLGESMRLTGLKQSTTAWLSYSGKHVAVVTPTTMTVWQVDGAAPRLALELKHRSSFGFLREREAFYCFSPDRKMTIYDLTTGKPVRSVKVPEVPTASAFRPGHPDEVALAGPGGTRVVNVATGRVKHHFPAIEHGGWVDWRPDGEQLAVAGLTRVHLYSLRPAREVWVLDHPGDGLSIGYTDDGKALASQGWDGRLRLWCPRTGRLLLAAATPTTNWLRVGRHNRLSAPYPNSGSGGQWRLSEVVTSRVYRTLVAGVAQRGQVHYGGVSLHPGGRLLAVGTHEGLFLIDLETGEERDRFPDAAFQVRFLPSGDLLTASLHGDRCLRWSVTIEAGAALTYHIGRPALMPGRFGDRLTARDSTGRRRATLKSTGARVELLDRGGKQVALGPHPGCTVVVLSADGALAATASDKQNGLKVWEVESGRLLHEWPEQPMQSLPAFSADRRLLALAAPGGVTRLIDLATGKEVVRLSDPNQAAPSALTFDATASRLIVATNDSRAVHVWDLRRLREELRALALDWSGPPEAAAPAKSAPRASASTTAEATRPAGAIDGDRFGARPTSLWRGKAGERSWWWQVELPAAQPIGAILQVNGDHELALRNGPRKYVWQLSTDGQRWESLEETLEENERRAFRLHRLKATRSARFVRLLIEAATGDAPALREVELFAQTDAAVSFPPWSVIVSTTGGRTLPGEGLAFLPLARQCKGFEPMQAQSVALGDFREALLQPEPRPLCAFLSGNFIDWCQQKREDWRGVQEVLTKGHLPMWAACGGAQGLAILADVGVDRPWDCPHCRDPKAPKAAIYGHIGHTGTGRRACGDYSQCVFERGPHSVRLVADDPAFAGLPREFRTMESHCGQVEYVPKGWRLVVTNGPGGKTKMQCMRREDRYIYAAQFHIELAGTPASSKAIMANFLKLARQWGGYNPQARTVAAPGKLAEK